MWSSADSANCPPTLCVKHYAHPAAFNLPFPLPLRQNAAPVTIQLTTTHAARAFAPAEQMRFCAASPRNIRVSLSALRGVSPSEKYQKAIKEALNKSRHAPCLHIFCLIARKLLEIHQVFLRRFHTIKRKICLRNLHTRFNQHFLKSRRIAIISHLPRGFQSALPSPTSPKRRAGYDTAYPNARGARICSCGANALLRGFAAHQIVFRAKRFARRASRLTNPLSRAIITL